MGSRVEWAWAGGNHKYIPLKITLLEKDFFGWFEVSISSEDGAGTLHSFTYNAIPGSAVTTGVLYWATLNISRQVQYVEF